MASPAKELPHIILGSGSMTRQAILREMGYEYEVMKAGIDESAIRREKPEDLVLALSHAKAQAIEAKLAAAGTTYSATASRHTLLITADQVVVHEGVIREKPLSEQEARLFISGYGRAPASTVGAVLVTNLNTGFKTGAVDSTEVYFHPIPADVVEKLVKDENTYNSAGGLMVEHPLVSPLVEAMVGSIDSVMGLPKKLTEALIQEALQSKE
eukprot:jgi/Mesen1/7548/ME000392S06806